MTAWNERSHEERHLFNPAFCSSLLWHSAMGAKENQISQRSSLSYVETFLILPLALHQRTRESIPIRVTSSLPVWVSENPLAIASFPARARSLVPHTKEALFFGACSGLFEFEADQLLVNADRVTSMRKMRRRVSAEVDQCYKKAHFLGKWLTRSGTPETILTLLGIRP